MFLYTHVYEIQNWKYFHGFVLLDLNSAWGSDHPNILMILNLTSAFFIFSSVTFCHWLSITLTWSHKSALRHNKNSKKNNSTISTRKSAVYLRGSKEKLINNQTPPYELLNGGAGSMCQEGIGTLQIVRQGTFTHSATALTDSLLIATKNY